MKLTHRESTPEMLEAERVKFEAWCAANSHGTLDDMMMPLDRALKNLLWSAWQGRAMHDAAPKGQSEPVAWISTLQERGHDYGKKRLDWVPIDALQPCGHPKSLALQSAESGEPLYCEACDDKSGRRDAELRESELAAANVALRERIAGLEAQRVPLTDEQIADAVREADLDWHHGWTLDETEANRFTQLVRAVERAHGIEDVKP